MEGNLQLLSPKKKYLIERSLAALSSISIFENHAFAAKQGWHDKSKQKTPRLTF
jgi:hypothetical protein